MRVYHRLEVRLLLPKPFSIAKLLETVRVVLRATDSARAQLEPLPDWQSQPSAEGLRL
jgi:DNA-binding response OmpR family regulator